MTEVNKSADENSKPEKEISEAIQAAVKCGEILHQEFNAVKLKAAEQMGDLTTGAEAERKTQVGIRLDPEMTRMLGEIRNWFEVRDPRIELLSEEAQGKGICSSDTSVARFILEAGIKHLYGELELERINRFVFVNCK